MVTVIKLKAKYYIIKNNIIKQKGIRMKFLTKIVLLLALLSFISLHAESEVYSELSTDDIENPSVLNSLGPVEILNLSGYYNVGRDVERFKIVSLPDSSAGILYLEDGETEVQVDQILNAHEANTLQFDPNPDFVGNATFQYASVNINDEVDPNPATVTIPVYAKNTDVNGTSITSTSTKDCCEDYNSSVPSLSLWSMLTMLMLTLFITREELNREF